MALFHKKLLTRRFNLINIYLISNFFIHNRSTLRHPFLETYLKMRHISSWEVHTKCIDFIVNVFTLHILANWKYYLLYVITTIVSCVIRTFLSFQNTMRYKIDDDLKTHVWSSMFDETMHNGVFGESGWKKIFFWSKLF